MYLEYKTRLELAAIIMHDLSWHRGTNEMQASVAFDKLDALIAEFETRIKDGKYKT